jgi:hypothetical protein
MSQHRAQAEVYARQGDFSAAAEQLQIALKTNSGDFYQKSSIEARLKELRELAANKAKMKEKATLMALPSIPAVARVCLIPDLRIMLTTAGYRHLLLGGWSIYPADFPARAWPETSQ